VPPVSQGGFPFGSCNSDLTDDEIDKAFHRAAGKPERQARHNPQLSLTPKTPLQELLDSNRHELLEMAEEDPEKMADLVCLLIIKYKGLKAESAAIDAMFDVPF
jgi:predicted transcriptional regulator